MTLFRRRHGHRDHHFSSLKIGTKLLLGFGLVLACLIAMAALSLTREALDQTGLAARNAFIFTDPAAAHQEVAILDGERALYLSQLAVLERRFDGNAQFAELHGDMLAMAHELDRLRKYRDAGQMAEYGAFLVKECSPLRRKIGAEIGALIQAVQAEQRGANAAADILFPDIARERPLQDQSDRQ